MRRRAVFVGSPLAGTGLAAPSNIRSSLGLISNIANALGAAAAALPYLAVLTGLFRVVTSVTSLAAKTPAVDAAIALVPGSMTELSDGVVLHPDHVFDFGTTDRIHHTNYFEQPDTPVFIRKCLAGNDEKV